MGIFDKVFKRNDDLKERLIAERFNNSYLKERISELEALFSLEEQGWERLGADDKEFSAAFRKQTNRMARIYWLKNPLIRRAVYTQTAYVFGQGVEFQTQDEDVKTVIDDFLNDRDNRTELTSHQARMMKETELQLFGNLFFVFFKDKSTGQVKVRTIDVDEINNIITNPEDKKEPFYYHRVWREVGLNGKSEFKEAYYPDYRYTPASLPPKVNGKPVVDNPIYHVKVNCLSDMKFGVSEVYAALDWAKSYKEFLEDWSTLVRAISQFAYRLTHKGGKKAVEDAMKKLESEGKFSPGSFFVGNEGVKLEPVSKSGATTSVQDGRRLLLMVSAATGIFEHYFGDPSTGNLATATAMERPMEIMFKDRQQLWASIFKTIFSIVINASADAPRGILKGKRERIDDKTVVHKYNINTNVDVVFPDILKEDIETKVDSIVKAATLDGKIPAEIMPTKMVAKMLLTALGAESVDDIIDEFYTESTNTVYERNIIKELKKLNANFDQDNK